MARLTSSEVYTKKKGKAPKEVNVEDVNLELNSDCFKAMQDRKHFLSFDVDFSFCWLNLVVSW